METDAGGGGLSQAWPPSSTQQGVTVKFFKWLGRFFWQLMPGRPPLPDRSGNAEQPPAVREPEYCEPAATPQQKRFDLANPQALRKVPASLRPHVRHIDPKKVSSQDHEPVRENTQQ